MKEFRIPKLFLPPLVWAVERYVTSREPDEKITIHGGPYMNRWKILPVNRVFNVFVHYFMHSDEDRALHDHPWGNCSILLRGAYREILNVTDAWIEGVHRSAGSVVIRDATEKHRIQLYKDLGMQERPVLTIFIRFRKWREWGFICKDGRWFHWRNFLAEEDRSDWNLCETDLPGNVPGQGRDTGPDGDRA